MQLQVRLVSPMRLGSEREHLFSRRRGMLSDGLLGRGVDGRVTPAAYWPCEEAAEWRVWRCSERVGCACRGVMASGGRGAVAGRDLYDRLAEWVLNMGRSSRGCGLFGERGEEVFAEVSLLGGSGQAMPPFGVHPALLDAALHAVLAESQVMTASGEGAGGVQLPFSFSGVELYALGCSSSAGVSLPGGGWRDCLSWRPMRRWCSVASVDSLVVREFSAAQLGARSWCHRDSLFAMGWSALSVSPEAPAEELAVLGAEGCAAG